MSKIISFRGLLASGAQERISLETIRGEKGYRIVKLATIDKTPGTNILENVLKIYKVQQAVISGTIDFSNQTLLAVAYFATPAAAGSGIYDSHVQITFDKDIVNQDIYVTSNDNSGNNNPINYYLELEQMDLNLDEATVATLKDIRNND